VVYVGNGDDYRIRTYDVEGRLMRIIGRRVEPIPANQAQIDSYFARVRERTGEIPAVRRPEFERSLRESESRLQDRLSHYQTMPAFHGLLVDEVARLWVRNDPTRFTYDVFGSEGHWLGPVTLPSDPLFVGEEEVILAGTDPLGVPFVELYSLVSG
jgi:hypothetical protein